MQPISHGLTCLALQYDLMQTYEKFQYRGRIIFCSRIQLEQQAGLAASGTALILFVRQGIPVVAIVGETGKIIYSGVARQKYNLGR
ncbi:MAG: hypothetical protein VXZ84_10030 [Planctomycetota bacterium]|nr:hypothetical protein [Planctomycetota bacterium]